MSLLTVLAGDVGGTKVHLGLFQVRSDHGPPSRPTRLRAATYASRGSENLEQLISSFLEGRPDRAGSGSIDSGSIDSDSIDSDSIDSDGIDSGGIEPGGLEPELIDAACFGVAGPVIRGACRVTNLPWAISEAALRERFGWPRVTLVNDLAAMAAAVTLYRRSELVCLNDVPGEPRANRVVIAPGTGLGQALLIADGERLIPVASEGGHSDLAPRSETEVGLMRHLERRYGHASYERVVSGQGLGEILSFVLELRRLERPGWLDGVDLLRPGEAVSEAGLAEPPEPLAREVLDIFVRCLAGAASNLALTALASGGVYLGGGIPPKILPALSCGAFMKAFTDKGRFSSLLASMPVHVMLDQRSALLGAARLAAEAACGASESRGSAQE